MIFTYYNILKQITLLHNTTIKYFAFVALVLSLKHYKGKSTSSHIAKDVL